MIFSFLRCFDSFLSPWFIFHLGIYPNLLWAHFHTKVTYDRPNMVVWSGEYWTTFSIILPQFCVNFHFKNITGFSSANQSHSSKFCLSIVTFPSQVSCEVSVLVSYLPFLFSSVYWMNLCPLAVLIISLMKNYILQNLGTQSSGYKGDLDSSVEDTESFVSGNWELEEARNRLLWLGAVQRKNIEQSLKVCRTDLDK